MDMKGVKTSRKDGDDDRNPIRVLVTGGCGFIGSSFITRLFSLNRAHGKEQQQQQHWFIVNVDCLYPCSTRLEELTESSIDNHYVFVRGNITDISLMVDLLNKYTIDMVVHFAAQSHVDASFMAPISYTRDNILGTHTLLEACRSYGKLKRFLQISTDEVYGENQSGAFHEKSLLKPTNPYAATKASAEMLVHSYIHSYNLPALVIRGNNVYGPGQYPEKVIPKFILKLLHGEKMTIQGTGEQQRSFLYITDAVSAIYTVLLKGNIGDIYNISSNDELSINSLAEKLLYIMKPKENIKDWIVYTEDRKFNDQRYWIKSKPLEMLGWKQLVDFEQGIRKTITWYQNTKLDSYWISTKSQIILAWNLSNSLYNELKLRGLNVVLAKYDVRSSENRAKLIEEIDHIKPSVMMIMIDEDEKNMTPLVLTGIARLRGIYIVHGFVSSPSSSSSTTTNVLALSSSSKEHRLRVLLNMARELVSGTGGENFLCIASFQNDKTLPQQIVQFIQRIRPSNSFL